MKVINLPIKSILFLALSLAVLSASIEEEPGVSRLALYIGKGYNILHGNPSSNGIDPGFSHQIFQFSYDKHQTTEDGKYEIPDEVSHRKTSSCSFTTQITQYRGTESYQSQLKTKAQISGGYKGTLFKASFSASTAYEKLHNETLMENQTITHASAECQCYEMSLNLFKPGKISENFWQGVNYSYHGNNWDKFITQFGTHFVYEVVLGGRAIQEIQYDWKSISQMESIGIDVNIAAKAKFASYYMDTSFDFHKYETQIKYAETLSHNIHEINIGGEPVKGNIAEWHQKVIENPMPITYKVLPLSELFEFNPDKSIPLDQAKAKYEQALDHYCSQNKCKQPQPDKPKPPPAKITIQKTEAYGGGGGSAFEWEHSHPALNLHKVHIRSGSQLDNIQLQLSDGVETFLTPQFGGGGGSQRDPWEIPKNQFIHQIQYRSGDRVDSITFVTNKGTRSPKFGGNGGSYHLMTLPDGFRVIGLFGHQGGRVDQLGFVIAKTEYHETTGQTEIIKKNLLLNQE